MLKKTVIALWIPNRTKLKFNCVGCINSFFFIPSVLIFSLFISKLPKNDLVCLNRLGLLSFFHKTDLLITMGLTL